jgi:uncharacterized membrane protein YphA (DoxX/SURF4 family)
MWSGLNKYADAGILLIRLVIGIDFVIYGLMMFRGGTVGLTYHATADPKTGQGTRHFGLNSGGGVFQATEFLAMPDTGVPPAPWVPVNSGK